MVNVAEKINETVCIAFHLTKREVIDIVLRTVQKSENYWRFLQRDLMARGIHVSASSYITVDYVEPDGKVLDEPHYVVKWSLNIYIPESLIHFIAQLRRRRKWKPPKEHPIVRQRKRLGEEISEEMMPDNLDEESEEENELISGDV